MKKNIKTISFVIPIYNEELRISKTFTALKKLSIPNGLKLEKVIFVNDGSKDQSVAKINKFRGKNKKIKNIKLISYAQNKGKGYAVRAGMKESSSDYTLFFDADISTPLSEISKLVPFIKNDTQVIVGTRKNGHSTVIQHQPKLRELLGKGFTLISKTSLGLKGTDFTCGFKAFSKEAKDIIFAQAIIDGWGYDAEIIFLAQKYNLSVAEKAVIWSNDQNTKVKLYKAVPQTIKEIASIRWNHNVKSLFVSPSSSKSYIGKPAIN